MIQIGITQESFVKGETETIERLLDSTIHRIHIRKPRATENAISKLIESIDPRYYPCLSLHDAPHLALEYGLGGVHLNARHPAAPPTFAGIISRSCHSIDELRLFRTLDYLFLSPIFNSISKQGYQAAFTDEELHRAASEGTIDRHVYALGGVTPAHLPHLHALGFGGAVYMGSLWQN